MHQATNNATFAALLQYNATLLAQAIGLIEQLTLRAEPGFVYARAIGPHVRHILEHYQALLAALAGSARRVDYDVRARDVRIQTDPNVTCAILRKLIEQLNNVAATPGLSLQTPLTTRLQAGERGELELDVPTSLGRELLFVSSHTAHHYALLGHYCRAVGVDPGHDFGKAPATVAYERAQAAIGA